MLHSVHRFAVSLFLFAFSYGRESSNDVVTAEVLESKKDFPCHSLQRENYTCGACIQFHDTCAWCSQEKFEGGSHYSRCDSYERLKEHGCQASNIQFPKTTVGTVENRQLSDAADKASEEEATQLKPQRLNIEIRPKSRVRFDVTYRQAVDYPVDLYYLMDLSSSMNDDKKKLSELGGLLAGRMKNITKNFRLGFGSFIDKKLMPFVDIRPEKLRSPCELECAEPYGFKNQMSLTNDTNRFSERVRKAEISGNLDVPEGGLDALIQVLACKEIIGWRERARKMIVFSTDAGFHYAGDGMLAGLVQPNDGQCHLDAAGYYTKTLEQDYPSIALLHQKIKERKANLIFAVTQKNKKLYEQLSEALPDVSSSVGVLANDSSNVVTLIEDEYNKISQKIIMVDNANATQGLRLSYRSKCLNGNTLKETNVCDGIKVGDEVTFEVTLEATHCVKQHDFELKIGPSGLDETLTVDVHVQCDCDCELRGVERNSAICNFKGDLACGVCECSGTNVGRHCECDALGLSIVALNAKCRRTNESAICEGRGVCECGVCKCIQRDNVAEEISGEFCECDNFDCPRHSHKLCAGRGTCDCGKCKCEPGWTGRACECPISQDSCIASNGKICNGQGECICGRCRCFTDGISNRYSGPTCELCPTCPTKCVQYRPCVMCQLWKTGPYSQSQCDNCSFTVIPVKELPALNDSKSEFCQSVDPSDDCTFYYFYYHDEKKDNLTVWAKEEKDCPPPVPLLPILAIVIAGIVILGLILLLVWKLLTMLHDRAEYARFEKDRLEAEWSTNENPIFRPPTTTFKNPAYAGNEKKNK